MRSSPAPTVKEIVQELRESPVFQMSLSSRELFHSNFLAWLVIEYPSLVGPLFVRFLKKPQPTCTPLEVFRERKNIDLELRFPSGARLVVENKVKSLPDFTQLEKYAGKFKNMADTDFLLLSLARPVFLPPGKTTIPMNDRDGVVWHFLSYRDLGENLRDIVPQIAAANGYHGALLQDYVDLVCRLDSLQTHFALRWDDFDGDFFGEQEGVEHLKSIRFNDVIEKMRHAQLVECAIQSLRNQGFDDIVYKRFPDERRGQISVRSSMTRGVGLFDMKYVVMEGRGGLQPVLLGIQVQGRHFRINVEMKSGPALAIATELWNATNDKKVWFDFSHLASVSAEYPKKGVFNKFGQSFYYRSKKLASISPLRLVDVVVKYATLIRENEAVLRRQIEAAI